MRTVGRRGAARGALALVALGCAAPALAQAAVQSIAPATQSPNLGNVVSGTATTTFTIDAASGAVTQSGDGVRLTTGAVTNPLVTITCSGGLCNTQRIGIRIASGGASGRASITTFTVGSLSGSTFNAGAPPAAANPLSFYIDPIGNGGTASFRVAPSIAVSTTGATGNRSLNFTVAALRNALPTSGGSTGSARVRVFRAISLTKNADLAFGKLVRPASGQPAGTATVSPAGARTVSGLVAFAAPAPTAARFTASGEGAQSISLSIPATIVATRAGGSETLIVTTSNDLVGAPTAQTLSSTLGNAGTRVVNVGGAITVADTTATGNYSGTLPVTVQYN